MDNRSYVPLRNALKLAHATADRVHIRRDELEELLGDRDRLHATLAEGIELTERFDRYSMKGVDVDGDEFTEQYHVVPKTGNWHRILGWKERAFTVLKGK